MCFICITGTGGHLFSLKIKVKYNNCQILNFELKKRNITVDDQPIKSHKAFGKFIN